MDSDRTLTTNGHDIRRRSALMLTCSLAAAIALTGALLVREPTLGTALAILVAVAAVLLWLNPPLSRFSFWALVAVLIAGVLGPNLRPPGAPGWFIAYRLLLALFLVSLAASAALRSGKMSLPHAPFPAGLWLPVVGLALASLLWCRDVVAGLQYCIFLSVGVFLVFVIGGYARDGRRLRTMLIASGCIAAAVMSFGVIEKLTGYHLPESASVTLPARYGWMVTSVFHNPNEFATYIALWLPIFAAVLLASRSLTARIACAGVCAMGLYCLLSTGSRANILALTLALVTLIGIMSIRWPLRVVPVLGIAAIIGMYGFHTFATTASRHQMGALEMSDVLSEGTRARGELVRDGLSLLAGSFGAGLGAGNLETHMAALGHRIQNAHNWWLEILVNLGVLSFGLYVWFYGAVAVGLYRAYHTAPERWLRLVAVGFLSGWVGFTIGCLSSSSLIKWAPMWIYFGLAVGVIEACRAASSGERDASADHLAHVSEQG